MSHAPAKQKQKRFNWVNKGAKALRRA